MPDNSGIFFLNQRSKSTIRQRVINVNLNPRHCDECCFSWDIRIVRISENQGVTITIN